MSGNARLFINHISCLQPDRVKLKGVLGWEQICMNDADHLQSTFISLGRILNCPIFIYTHIWQVFSLPVSTVSMSCCTFKLTSEALSCLLQLISLPCRKLFLLYHQLAHICTYRMSVITSCKHFSVGYCDKTRQDKYQTLHGKKKEVINQSPKECNVNKGMSPCFKNHIKMCTHTPRYVLPEAPPCLSSTGKRMFPVYKLGGAHASLATYQLNGAESTSAAQPRLHAPRRQRRQQSRCASLPPSLSASDKSLLPLGQTFHQLTLQLELVTYKKKGKQQLTDRDAFFAV